MANTEKRQQTAILYVRVKPEVKAMLAAQAEDTCCWLMCNNGQVINPRIEAAPTPPMSINHPMHHYAHPLGCTSRPPQVTLEAGQPSYAARAEADTADPREPAFTAVAPARPPRLVGEAQPVYVSYAWGGESETLVDELERRLPESFKLIRDKNVLRPGDWISHFMAEIGRADLVVVVLSDKYVRSVYCMQELLYLFQTSQGARDTLMQRIVPLLVGELKCARVAERDRYARYWDQEYATVDALLKQRGLGSVGNADRAEWLAIQNFKDYVSDLLAWVADTLMPWSTELHTQGIDAAVQLLQQRTLALRG